MKTYQYNGDPNAIVADIDNNATYGGLSLIALGNVTGFYTDRAEPDAENPDPGPLELCVEVADEAMPPAIRIISGGSLMPVPVQEFVGHPIRRPH